MPGKAFMRYSRQMRWALPIAVALLAGVTHAAEDVDPLKWKPPARWEIVPLALAGTSMAIDMLQSMDIKNHPGRTEGNPLLGKHPSDAQYVTGVGFGFLVLTVIWYAMPPRLRVALPTGIFVAEVGTIIENHSYGLRIRL